MNRVFFVGFCALASTGCMGAVLSQSAQAIPEGTVQHQAGAEWYVVMLADREETLISPIPFYGVRVGLVDAVEFGFRLNVALSNFALDLKIQGLDSEYLDVALVPTVQYGWTLGWVHLPLLVGINLGDHVQLTFSGRIAHTFPLLEDDSELDDAPDAFGTDAQVVVGAGLSIYVRVLDEFAIVPEFQMLRGFGDNEAYFFTGGIALTFGAQPGVTPTEEPELPPDRPASGTDPGTGPPVVVPAGYGQGSGNGAPP
jgi:hypothetical protein